MSSVFQSDSQTDSNKKKPPRRGVKLRRGSERCDALAIQGERTVVANRAILPS